MTTPAYPKRLIEVDLPIKRISAHARREKSIRHGHISTLHIWWARRPLAACRAVICAALWPDPADPLCPKAFREEARRQMLARATDPPKLTSEESFVRLVAIQKKPSKLNDDVELRGALLDFIADFANWDSSMVKEYLETSHALTQAAHEALGGAHGTRPLVVDPFAGGGAIPLEALRVGADAFASDLNPVAVLLNKVVLEYIPKYGQRLADEVRKWGAWVSKEAERELAVFYPKDPDGATPLAYLWSRTIKCEGPGCGAEVPIFRSPIVAKRKRSSVSIELRPNVERKTIGLAIVERPEAGSDEGTARRGSVTCPCCHFTTAAVNVRKQFANRAGGAGDARMLAVVSAKDARGDGKSYRLASAADLAAVHAASAALSRKTDFLAPNEPLPYLRSIFNIKLLGVDSWGDLFSPRQKLQLTTFGSAIVRAGTMLRETGELAEPTMTLLAIALDKMADFHTSLAAWIAVGEKVGHTFGRQALGIVWDFSEANPFADISGAWLRCLGFIDDVITANVVLERPGHVERASATKHPLPDDTADAAITDPPYYDLVPYADLSDFFYVWLKRAIGPIHPALFSESLSPKSDEIVQLAERNRDYAYKTRERYEELMAEAMREARRVVRPSGISIVVFAHKGTAAWESQLEAMIRAGWVVTASWPIDTERTGRLRAMDSAALASSVHLVCRPRENADGSLRTDEIGDWRDVLAALPRRIHEWMPRLRDEGIVGADAIFACLGPALEIFSRYSKVEKASGEVVTLKEYLEHVWAAVAKEALAVIFSGADTAAFEEDARLTAMWLWTLNGGAAEDGEAGGEDAETDDDDADASGGNAKAGFVLEYDAARKIAQGLGAHLEDLTTLVAVKGSTARLLPVAERATSLFGQPETAATAPGAKKKRKQLTLGFVADGEADAKASSGLDGKLQAKPGTTVLDRVHQAMILFGAGRGEALRRFLVDDGAGKDDRFWRLGQALAALYPTGTDERRFIEGVMARKKGLGL